MRILVCSDTPPYVIGGAEMQAWRLAKTWQDKGHIIEIAGHRIPSTTHENIRLHHLQVFYAGGRILRALSYFISLAIFLIKREKCYDIIYCRFVGEATLSISLLKHIGAIKLPLVSVPAAAGSLDKSDAALLRSLPFLKRLTSIINNNCDCINYIAPGIDSSLTAVGINPRFTAHIPNGVPIPAATRVGTNNTPYRLLFVGRIEFQKGLDTLFAALDTLCTNGYRFEMRIIGIGSELESLRQFSISHKLENNVIFLGEQNQDAIQHELSNAHFFVLPSRYEGISNAALEALAFGLPPILTKCGGLDTYISADTGWVCDPENSECLYSAIRAAISVSSHQWSIMSKNCRRLATKNFSIDKIASRNIQLFETLLEQLSFPTTTDKA
jgi:glycosyltransferase involved in cell wall biosynthesis